MSAGSYAQKLADIHRRAEEAGLLSDEDIRRLYREARGVIPRRVREYAERFGVTYGRITIRLQKTRWGSCSSKGGLNFNCLLMLAPEDVLDYVIAHELCHRKEMNHSKRFHEELAKVFPREKDCRAWLRRNGPVLLARAGRI